MARHEEIIGYRVAVAATSGGYDGWRATIVVTTLDADLGARLRFVDDPAAWADRERVVEQGVCEVFVHVDRLAEFHQLVQSERPLFLTIRDGEVAVQSGHEPVGEEEAR